MGTRSAVCEPHGDSYRGRYVHWDGYPSGVGRALSALVQRDGLEVVRKTIIHDHYGWSSLDETQTVSSKALIAKMKRKGLSWHPEYGTAEYHAHSFSIGYNDGRFAQVKGYGVAYTTEQGQSWPDEWIRPEADWGTEWRYVLTDSALRILRGYGVNPRHHATLAWDEAFGLSSKEWEDLGEYETVQ